MDDFGGVRLRDEALLAARVLMIALFVVFGWGKMMNFTGTAAYFDHSGLPAPTLATVIAVVMELPVGLAFLVGAYTRPLAVLLAVYTLATAFLGHHFWSKTGQEYIANEINFFKNLSIIGGFLALYVTGAGRYSVDAALQRVNRRVAA